MNKDSQQRDPAELVPLLPAVFHIMLALAEGECHGYGIMLEVERLTDGQIHLGPGTLYRSIQRMLVDGFIEELDNPDAADADRRRCYRLSAHGRRVAQEEARRLATLLEASLARGLLKKTGRAAVQPVPLPGRLRTSPTRKERKLPHGARGETGSGGLSHHHAPPGGARRGQGH